MVGNGTSTGITRRRLLEYAAAAPTLAVGVRLADAVVGRDAPAGAQVAELVDFTDALTLAALPTQHLLRDRGHGRQPGGGRLPRAEVGQGITTAVAQIVAEELDARLADVDVVLEDARPELLFNQLTGGSNSVHALYGPLRAAAAGARARLVTAAARRWGVAAPATLVAPRHHGRGPRRAHRHLRRAVGGRRGRDRPRGAARAQGPRRLHRRRPADHPHRRPRHRHRPGPLHPGPRRCPAPCPASSPGRRRSAGPCARSTTRAARAMPGVVAVTRIPTGVAVVAETFDQALAGPRRPARHLAARARRRTCPTPTSRRRLAAATPAVRPPAARLADRRPHLRVRLRAPRPAGGAQLRRRRAGRPGRAVAAVEEPDRRRPDGGPRARPAGRPGDAPRRPGRRLVRAPAVLRPGDRGGAGVEGHRPAGAADVDPRRRHAPRPPAPGQPPPGPGHPPARPRCSSYEHRMALGARSTAATASASCSPRSAPRRSARSGPAMFHAQPERPLRLRRRRPGRCARSTSPSRPGSWRSVFSGQVRTVDEVMVDEVARALRPRPGGVPAVPAPLGPAAGGARPGGGGRDVGPADGAGHRPGRRRSTRSTRASSPTWSRSTPATAPGPGSPRACRRGRRRPGGQPPGPRGPDAGRPGRRPVGDPAGRGAHRRRRRAGGQLHRLPLRPHAAHPGRGRGARHAPDRRARRRRRAGRARPPAPRSPTPGPAPPARCPAASRSSG